MLPLPARLNGSELIAFRELAPSDLIELEVESPVWSARHLLTELVTRPELPHVSCHREDYSLSKLTLCCPFLPSCYLWEGKKAAGDGADYYEFLFALLCSQTTNVLRSSCLFSSCMINNNKNKIPSEMEVAPRYNCWPCWHCWHCWHCWYCSTLLTWRIMSSHFIHICLVPIFQ